MKMPIFIDHEDLAARWHQVPPEHEALLLRILRTPDVLQAIREIRLFLGISPDAGLNVQKPEISLTDRGVTVLANIIQEVFIEGLSLDDSWMEFFLRWIVEGRIYRWPITHKKYWERQKNWSLYGIEKHKIRRTENSTFEIQNNGPIGEWDMQQMASYINHRHDDVPAPERSKDHLGSLLNFLILYARHSGLSKTKDICTFVENKCMEYKTRAQFQVNRPSSVQSLSADPLRKRVGRFDKSFPELKWTGRHVAPMSNASELEKEYCLHEEQ